MNKLALVAEFGVKPERRAQFLELMVSHAKSALDEEEGCLQFDVAVARDNENQIVLYELYKDDAAMAEHMNSAHLAETRKAYADMIATKRVTICKLA
ncbi:MAG: antibiotic biosynthesis monooxygenase [Pseudomonadota bacterium]|nr:antibiotic biosynthesis monooxygenase [Pseudomonadota bacterium]